MNLVERLATWIMSKAAGGIPAWASSYAESQKYTHHDYSMLDSQSRAYQVVSWINIAVNVLGSLVSTLDFHVAEMEGEERKEVDNHPFELLLANPNPNMSRQEFLFATVAWQVVTGSSYWWLNAPMGGKPTEMWVVPSRLLRPVPDGRMFLRGYLFKPDTEDEKFIPENQIIAFKRWHPFNEFQGLSAIECIARTAESDQKMNSWNMNLFAEDNAKFPGILAIEQMMSDPQWERVKQEFQDDAGGTRRSLRMIRGVGAGGVHWIQTNLVPKDMEFIQGRNFSRTEIFDALAPGLSAALSIETTYANSMVGKKFFMEAGVWPICDGIARKVNQKLLPRYGQLLQGKFDDPRVVDRSMVLQEQQMYAQVHTVDEVRQKYYNTSSIGDDRGKLLVPEVTVSQAAAARPLSKETIGPKDQYDEEERVARKTGETKTKAIESDLARWRRYALKRDNGRDGLDYSPDHIPEDVAEVVRHRLKAAASREEVIAAFAAPF